MNKKINVVIYARYSSARQNEMSIEGQLKEAKIFCEQNNYNIVREYIDRAKSAKSDNRPQFLEMIKDSKKREFEIVVVYQLDRFSRNRYDSANYKAKLKKNGVKVVSIKEKISDDASGILMESVIEGMAEYYSAELAQKVNRGLTLNAEKGYFNGGVLPLGYKLEYENIGSKVKKRIVIDKESALIVKELFEMRANNTKLLDIVDYLNSKGYRTAKGTEFKAHSLDRTLKNKKYIGIYTYKGIEYKNVVPAIVDEKLFNRVQEVIDNYKQKPGMSKAKEEYILTPKLYCGNCKNLMTGTCGTSSTGKTYYYYICNGIKQKQCKRKMVDKHYIEDMVIKQCRKVLTKNSIKKIADNIYEISQQESSQNVYMKSLEKRINELNCSNDNLIKAIEKGSNIDLINDKLTQNRLELEELSSKLRKEKNNIANLSKDEIIFFLSQLKSGRADNIKYRKTLINVLVNKIYLYDDKLTILFNINRNSISLDISLIEGLHQNGEGHFNGNLITTTYKNKKISMYYYIGGFALTVELPPIE